MLRKAIADIEAKYVRKDLPELRAGDTVRVHSKIKEGDKERVQVFEGVVIAYRKGQPGSSMFTVRKVSYGVGVERMFPVHSPRIDRIEVVGHGEVRRSRLYYLRELQGKAARLHQEAGGGAAAVPAAPAETPAPAATPAPQA
jgi:large subunit ribosomal protein L19